MVSQYKNYLLKRFRNYSLESLPLEHQCAEDDYSIAKTGSINRFFLTFVRFYSHNFWIWAFTIISQAILHSFWGYNHSECENQRPSEN